MKREMLSPRYTMRWLNLPIVQVNQLKSWGRNGGVKMAVYVPIYL